MTTDEATFGLFFAVTTRSRRSFTTRLELNELRAAFNAIVLECNRHIKGHLRNKMPAF